MRSNSRSRERIWFIRRKLDDERVVADARAEGGVSPAQLACWRNEFAVVERLVAAGVDVSQKNDAGCGFAHWLACAPRDAGEENTSRGTLHPKNPLQGSYAE